MDKTLVLFLLPLLAGCLDAPAEPEPAHQEVGVTDGADAALAPPCERVATNHGLWLQVGDHYVVPGPEPRVAYRESNGLDGLQTEASCPHDPDERLA